MNTFIRKKNIFRYIRYIFLLYLLMIFPLSQIIPEWVSWENNILENLQVIVLLIGCIMNMLFYRYPINADTRRMWLLASGFFLLLVGRELSWGRVFFQTAMTEHGPEFISMSQVPYHSIIHLAIGIYMVILAAGFITMVPWTKIFKYVKFPTSVFIMFCITAILSTCGDHRWMTFYDFHDETIEELAELLSYMILDYITIYYHTELMRFEIIHKNRM